MYMMTCVCMNPALDKTIELDELRVGGLNRVRRALYDATGKAVNVAIVLARLGEAARLVGVNYAEGGRAVAQRLADEGVASEFAWVDGALRVNIKALDRSTGVVTEINESGAPVDASALARVNGLIDAAAREGEFVALTGSLPPGVDDDFYRRAIERNPRARFVLDCDGARLREGIRARPFLIKPNRDELSQLCGCELGGRADIVRRARELCAAGVRWVAVSLGGEGALLVGAREAYFAPALDLPVRSTVGAGDSMVAGLMHGFAQDGSAVTALKWGAACGNASVITEGTRLIDVEALPRLIDAISVVPA